MKPHLVFVILCLSYSGWIHAEIYKRIDADGHVTYSSEPLKGSKKLYLKPLPTMSGRRESRRSTPEDFPKVDAQTQQRRDATRRIILEDELASEDILLQSARKKLQELESNPVALIGPDGVPFRGTAKYAEDIKSAQDQVSLHEQNVKALQTEISHLR